MDRNETTDSSDEHVMRALSRIRETFENNSPTNEDEALEILREKLFEFRLHEGAPYTAASAADVAEFHIRQINKPHTEAVLRWLADTNSLSTVDIKRIRRIRIFIERSDGRVIVRKQPLSDAWASVLIAAIASLTGAWISWVLFVPEGNLSVIAASFLLGCVFGLATRWVLDYSFRFAKLRAKIIELAPRLE